MSRRTVTKAIAWAAPVIAVAATVPSAAAASFRPPVFNWTGGCATVGNGVGGCNGAQKTGQVPVSLYNPSASPVVFQFVAVESKNSNSNTWSSVFTVYTNNGTENNCSPQVTSQGCGGYISVTVNPGATVNLWVVSGELQSAGAFDMNVTYRWIEPCNAPGTPVVIDTGMSGSVNIGSSNNCDGSPS